LHPGHPSAGNQLIAPDPQLPHLRPQRVHVEPQQARRAVGAVQPPAALRDHAADVAVDHRFQCVHGTNRGGPRAARCRGRLRVGRARGHAGGGPQRGIQRQPVALAEDHGPLDHRAQFPHVAGPVVGPQAFDVPFREARLVDACAVGGAVDEVERERGKVFRAFAQRRQDDREHGDAVPEVLA
ncbi:MAG: hypothetical protein ACK55I_14130, partial [bacterium]